jgi:CBS domain-containing protein
VTGCTVLAIMYDAGKQEESMLVASDIMTTDVITVAPETTVRDVAVLLHTRRISGAPVADAAGNSLGIVTEGDLVHQEAIAGEHRRSWWLALFDDSTHLARDYAKSHGRTARDIMTAAVISVGPTATLPEIASTLERHRIKRVPVIKDGKLVGIITRSNLLQALAAADVSRPSSPDDRAIREQLLAELQKQPWVHMALKSIVVQDGVVSLWGMVSTDDERRALRIAAENVPGVKRVEDQLTPIPTHRR